MEHKNGKTSETTTKRPAWFRNLFNFRFFSEEHPKISPQAVVHPNAEIADDVEVGPFCVVGPDVRIDAGCRLLNSVTIVGQTTVGRDNIFFPNSVIGTAPQDKKYKGAPTRLEIGDGNAFREAVSIHVGTEKGGGVTRIGNNNLFMVNSHVGHDAHVGSHCVLSNNVMIAGHVVVGDGVAMMGGVGVHHFVSIGRYAYVGGYARVHHDVPPFVKVDGSDEVRGLNKVGMTRSGIYTPEDIAAVEDAYRRLFLRKRPLAVGLAEFDLNNGMNPQVRHLVEFLHRRNEGKQGRFQEGLRAKENVDVVAVALTHAMPTLSRPAAPPPAAPPPVAATTAAPPAPDPAPASEGQPAEVVATAVAVGTVAEPGNN